MHLAIGMAIVAVDRKGENFPAICHDRKGERGSLRGNRTE